MQFIILLVLGLSLKKALCDFLLAMQIPCRLGVSSCVSARALSWGRRDYRLLGVQGGVPSVFATRLAALERKEGKKNSGFVVGPSCYRTGIPQSARESAGEECWAKADCWGDCWGQCWEAAFFRKAEKRHCSKSSA